MASLLPPFKITAGKYDVSYEAQNVSFSSVDPGGCEIASFDLDSSRAALLYPGDDVFIWDGLQCVWRGRIAEPSKSIKHGWGGHRKVGAQTTHIACEGSGAALKDNKYSMIYIDRALSNWTGPSTVRQALLIGTALWQIAQLTGPVVSRDVMGGFPSIAIVGPGPFANGTTGYEMYYDAGPGNLIRYLRFSEITPENTSFNGSFGWNVLIGGTTTDQLSLDGFNGPPTGAAQTVDMLATTFGTSQLYRYAFIQAYINTTGGGAAGTTYGWYFRNPSVLGNHGLTLHGTAYTGDGFYTSDIASHAVTQAIAQGADLKIGQVDSVTNYTVAHYLQRTTVEHEQVVADMAKLAPAHYGTWENSSIFEDQPEFTFRQYGNRATAFMALADSNEADISERLANMYTSATINYSDAAGSQYSTTVSLPNFILDRVGVKRTTTLDLGLSNSAAASVFASYVLQILFAQARSAGSIELPKMIRTSSGAFVRSYRLKAGIDRLRINDLPARSGQFTGSDTDSYRISRIETTVDTTSGQATTRVELDAGPNLMETLQARLQPVQDLVA